jgi:hypothetical protein
VRFLFSCHFSLTQIWPQCIVHRLFTKTSYPTHLYLSSALSRLLCRYSSDWTNSNPHNLNCFISSNSESKSSKMVNRTEHFIGGMSEDKPSEKYGLLLVLPVVFGMIVVGGLITVCIVYCSYRQERKRISRMQRRKKGEILKPDLYCPILQYPDCGPLILSLCDWQDWLRKYRYKYVWEQTPPQTKNYRNAWEKTRLQVVKVLATTA